MKEENTNILILGGGITSHSIAHHLEEKDIHDYLIVERETVPGGMIRDVIEDGNIFSTSGHFLHFKKDENRFFFEKKVPLKWKQRNSSVHLRNQTLKFPFQLNFVHMNERDVVKKIFIEFALASQKQEAALSFEEFLINKYGRTACEEFFFPYNRKLYGDLTKLDPVAMGRFFPDVDVGEVIDNMMKPKEVGYNTMIAQPVSKRFGDVLKAFDFDRAKLRLNTQILSIDFKEKIVVTSKSVIRYNELISTIPFRDLLILSNHLQIAKHFEASTLQIYNIIVNRRVMNDQDWIYYPEARFPFFRVGNYSNMFTDEYASRLYVECPEGTTSSSVVDGLINAKIISSANDIAGMYGIELVNAYNIISPMTIKLVEMFREDSVTICGRYGRNSYLSVEDCYEEGKSVVNKLFRTQ